MSHLKPQRVWERHLKSTCRFFFYFFLTDGTLQSSPLIKISSSKFYVPIPWVKVLWKICYQDIQAFSNVTSHQLKKKKKNLQVLWDVFLMLQTLWGLGCDIRPRYHWLQVRWFYVGNFFLCLAPEKLVKAKQENRNSIFIVLFYVAFVFWEMDGYQFD